MRRLINAVYFRLTGIAIKELQNSEQQWKGTAVALATLEKEAPALVSLEQYVDNGDTQDCRDLGELFRLHGSDKSTKHNYHLVYGALLAGRRQKPLKILEIGLGSNDPSFESNMGIDGKPGASVRAFRDWAPQAMLYGADIDRKTLFSEERIETYFVDQTKPKTFEELHHRVGGQFDLIIDDGLHTSWANINTINFALGLLKRDGSIVVEDILERYLPAWQVARVLLARRGYQATLVQCRKEIVCVITKTAREDDS